MQSMAATEDARAFWQQVYERFDPETPAIQSTWRAERPYSPRDVINAGLKRPFGTEKQYAVLGTVGTGKTTELLAIAEEQTRQRMVVFLDVWRHFQEQVGDATALHHVQPWEILFLIGLTVYRSARELLGHVWTDEHLEAFEGAVRVFVDTGQTRVGKSDGDRALDVAKLATKIVALAGSAVDGGTGIALRALGAATSAGRWNIRLGERGRVSLSDQDDRVRGLLNAVNLLIGTLQQRYQKLVIVVDGLDRINNEDTTRGLFVESTLLGSLSCATVLTGPLTLRRRRMAARMRHFEPRVLANVPVLDHREPGKPGPGIAFFLDIYRRRVAQIVHGGMGIPEPFLHELAYYSGGRARDFIRLVRMCAERAWDRAVPRVDRPIIDACIDERRRLMEMSLNRGHIQVLQEVMRDPQHLLPENELVEELLDQWCLLPFPNESEWYYPHPLLTLKLVPITG